jgi:2-methylcitrate dehydratase PrpD
MTALENLGAFVAAGVRGRVTGSVQELLALHVTDTVAAWVAASATSDAKHLEKLHAVLPRSAGDPSHDIAVNCAKVRLSEVDDIHLAAMITPGSIVVPATLSMAATMPGADVTALREAIVVGYEAMVRLGLAFDGPTILYRGIWPTYIAAGFGVAASASRLLGLTEEQTTNALALSLSLSPPGVAGTNAETTSRWIAAGASARNGWFAAKAAQAGFTSDKNFLDGKFFANVFGIETRISALTQGLGNGFLLNDVSFKPWCAARQTMAATQAFREILAEGVDANAITSIDVGCPPPFLRMIDHGIHENDRLSKLTSMPYQLAIAAFNPKAAYDITQSNALSALERALMDKVKVSADERLMAGFPAVWSARVRVQAGDIVKEKILSHVPGDPARPFDAKAVAQKFHAMADNLVGAALVDELIATTRVVLDGGIPPSHLLDKITQATSGKAAR